MNEPVLLHSPKEALLVTSIGRGSSKLNAFDTALVGAQIGDVSLIKVTSILPPDIQFTSHNNFDYGMSIPAIYSMFVSNKIDEVISATIGYIRTKNGPTLVAESAGELDLKSQISVVEQYLREMVEIRHLEALRAPIIKGIESKVIPFTCVFAGIIYTK